MKPTSEQPNPQDFDPGKLRILNITVVRGNIHAEERFFEKPVQPVSAKVDVGAFFGFHSAIKQARVVIRADFQSLSADGNPVGISGHYEIHFQLGLDNMDQFIHMKPDGREAFFRPVAVQMVAVAYSTARGVVFARTIGTVAQGVILPVVDSANLLQDPGAVRLRPVAPAKKVVKKTGRKKAKK